MKIEKSLLPEIYSQIFDSLADVVFMINIEGPDLYRFVDVNQAFLDITGLKHEEVVGRYVHETIPEHSLHLVLGKYKTAITEKRIVKWNEVTEYPTGRKYGEVTVVPIFDKKGNATSLVGSVHDVTPIREAEIHLAKTMERINDGIVSFDTKFNYTYVNSSGASYLGKKPEELIGKNYFDLYPEAAATPFANAYKTALKTQKPIEFRALYEPWNKWFENRIYPSVDGVTVFFLDITEEVERENELAHARKEAESAVVAKSQFLDIAAHELRNPVASLYLMLQVMDRQIQEGKTIEPERISELLLPATRLNRLVSDLLNLSRLEKNLLSMHFEVFDLNELLDRWTNEMKHVFPSRDISFIRLRHKVECDMDKVRIYQVFTNILENAIKYSHGSIRVKLEDAESIARFIVTDEGEGISEEMQKKIFDPFSRGGVDIKVRHTGLGLGLPLADRIVTLHSGKIIVKSEVGKGSTFIVELPKVQHEKNLSR